MADATRSRVSLSACVIGALLVALLGGCGVLGSGKLSAKQADAWVEAAEGQPGVVSASASRAASGFARYDTIGVSFAQDATVASAQLLDLLAAVSEVTDPGKTTGEVLVVFNFWLDGEYQADISPYVNRDHLFLDAKVRLTPGEFDRAEFEPQAADAGTLALRRELLGLNGVSGAEVSRLLDSAGELSFLCRAYLGPGLSADQADALIRDVLKRSAQLSESTSGDSLKVWVVSVNDDVDVAGLPVKDAFEGAGGVFSAPPAGFDLKGAAVTAIAEGALDPAADETNG